MDIYDKIRRWLEVATLEDILLENDLDADDALSILWSHGHIRIPLWLEDVYDASNEDEL